MSAKSIPVKHKNKRRSLYLGLDVPMFFTIVTLLAFGILMLYSASWQYSVTVMGENSSYMVIRQARFLALGCVLAIFVFYFDYHRIKKFVIPLMIFTLILLLMVIFYVEEVRLGAKRGLFSGSIQPSELAKLVIIIYLAFWLHAKQDYIKNVKFGLVPMAIILGTSSGLIFIQPDLSAAVTIFIIGGIMFFLGGGETRQIIFSLLLAIAAVLLILTFYETGKERIATYLSGLDDPTTASYHLTRSFEAIVRGGVFGVGIGRANTKFTGLPVAPTDSIFSVIAEETGLIGATFVILLFVVFLWRGLFIAKNAPDLLGQLLAAGITIWIFLEAFINMSVLVNLLPFAGNALPFISYGGSNLTMVLIGVGIVLNVGRVTAIQNNEEEGKPLNAVVNLRRNDGWRSVSRNSRPSSARRKAG